MTNRTWRIALLAFALILLTVPLQVPSATPAHAQTNPPGTTAVGAGSVTPGFALNYLGVVHTVTFTCTNAVAVGPVPAGCYAVSAIAQNATVGALTGIVQGTCPATPPGATGSSISCAFMPTGSSSSVSINPGAPDVYTITFSGYVPAPGGGCPAGTGAGATAVTGGTPTPNAITVGAVTAPGCSFIVVAQKKYFEVTGLVFTGGPCGGSLIWSEALKGYFGPSCTIVVVAIGTMSIKLVSDCASELAAVSGAGTTASLVAEFGPTARYVCTGNVLGVTGILATLVGAPSLPITLNVSGLGASTGITLGSGGGVYCAGVPGPITTSTGVPITLCPTGDGTAAMSACTTSSIGTQPRVCDTASLGTGPVATPALPGQKGATPTATPVTPTPIPTATSVPTGTIATVSFGAGWQQVGGPAGSNFSASQSLFSYDPAANTYADAQSMASRLSSAAPACTGYWSYTSAPMSVGIQVTSRQGDTATCSLPKGWNMVGNPFGSSAALPSDTAAYRWNGSAYERAGTIPAGGAVWVANTGDTRTSLTLTAQ